MDLARKQEREKWLRTVEDPDISNNTIPKISLTGVSQITQKNKDKAIFDRTEGFLI